MMNLMNQKMLHAGFDEMKNLIMRCSDECKQTEHIIGKYSNGEYTTEKH